MTLENEKSMLIFAASMIEKLSSMDLDTAQANAVLQNAMAYTQAHGNMPASLVMPATLTILQKMGENPNPMVVSSALQLATKAVYDWSCISAEYAKQAAPVVH